MPSTSFMGGTIRRREDPRLITGSATYVDDVKLPHMAHMAILRSPHAHARVVGIDIEAARRAPGVIDVVTGQTVAYLGGGQSEEESDPLEEFGSEESGGGERPPLATGIARFAGEGIAAVVAEDRYAAEDALELIEVEYETLSAMWTLKRLRKSRLTFRAPRKMKWAGLWARSVNTAGAMLMRHSAAPRS